MSLDNNSHSVFLFEFWFMKYGRKMLDDKMSERTKEILKYSTC